MQQIVILNKEDLRDLLKEMIPTTVEVKSQKDESDKLFTISEACEILRCSRPTLHRWKKNGIIPFVNIGGNIRYRKSDIEKILKSK
jgi:excisionase family DNA binding protein